MRLLQFADLHIGVELYGRPLPGKPWSSRTEDFLKAFDFLIDHAINEEVDAVIFAGDAYKAREPSQTHQREFAKRIRRLSEGGIATFLLVGNHDLPNAESRAHALEIFRTLDVPNVAVGDSGWFQREGHVPQILETRSGPLQVAFVPWPQISNLLANSEAAAGETIEQLYKRIEVAIAELVVAQAQHLDPQLPAVLTCHLPLSEKLVSENSGSELWMQSGSVPRVPLSALHLDQFDYVALGHHHNAMQLNTEPPCWYSGSLQEVDFGDAHAAKGFITLDLDMTKVRGARLSSADAMRFHHVPSRPFIKIIVKPIAASPDEEILASIAKEDVTDAIVKLELHINRDQEALLSLSGVRKALAKAHTIASIRTIMPEENRSPLPSNVQPDASAPIDTLETFLKARQVPEERRKQLIAVAEEIIEETEDVGN